MAKLLDDEAVTKKLPHPMPTDVLELLELMDDALNWAAGTLPGTYRFEHGKRLFDQAAAHYNLVVSREMASAHHGLKRATNKLSVATLVLVIATVALAVVTYALAAVEWGKTH